MKITVFLIFILVGSAPCKGQGTAVDYPRERMFFADDERIEAFDVDFEIVSIFRNFVTHINKQNPDEIYVPKNGESKKLSIIEGSKSNGKWILKIRNNEHEIKDVRELLVLLRTHFQMSETIALSKVDSVYLPVEYFDITQLEKL